MKKIILILPLVLVYFMAAPLTSAAGEGQSCVPSVTGACDFGLTCDPSLNVCVSSASYTCGVLNCAAPKTCVNNVCTTPAADTGGGGLLQATCSPACNSSQNCVSGVCVDNIQQNLNQPTPTGQPTGFVPLAPIPGLTSGATADTAGLANFLNNLYKYLIGLAAALAVIMIVWGGLEISTKDSVSSKSDGKKKIYNAIFGLVLILSPVLIFSIINPTILNLSINMGPLNTAWTSGNGLGVGGSGGNTGGGGGTPGQVSGTYLKKLATSDQNQANQFIQACSSSGGQLINACPTVDSQTQKPNCPGITTYECQYWAQRPYIFGRWPVSSSFSFQNISYVFTATDLVPMVSAEIPEEQQFAQTCKADGGTVCTTDQHLTVTGYVGGDRITCPDSSQWPSYSVPAGSDPTCFKFNPFCSDPNAASTQCNSSWSIKIPAN